MVKRMSIIGIVSNILATTYVRRVN
jgi:hypothetical protein